MIPFRPLSILVFTSIAFGNAELAKFSDPTGLDPELIGKYHTDAFNQLTEKYASHNPNDMKNVELDMFKIVSSYCKDYRCILQAYQGALEEIPLDVKSIDEVLSELTDDSVKAYLQSFESAIQSVNYGNVESVINDMEKIQTLIREDETLDEEGQYLGLAAGSVAIESTKLWTSVFSDPTHPLNIIPEISSPSDSFFQRRKLQTIVISTGSNFDLNFTIFADFVTLILFLGIPFPAIFASLWAFSVSDNPQDPLPSSQPSISFMPSISKTPSIQPSTIPSNIPTSSAAPSQ